MNVLDVLLDVLIVSKDNATNVFLDFILMLMMKTNYIVRNNVNSLVGIVMVILVMNVNMDINFRVVNVYLILIVILIVSFVHLERQEIIVQMNV